MTRFCDIIMKGGITSGVVYPAAVCEIAKDFTFKNVGGTSAGAIAAALTAAAERRRSRDGSMDGFARLEAVPQYLAQSEHLYRLFLPSAATRSLYRTIVSLFGRPRFRPAWLTKWCGLVWAYPVASAAGGLAGSLFLVLTLKERRGPLMVAGLFGSFVTINVGITLAILVALGRDVLRELPRNNYGMVKGVDDADRDNPLALCTWLARELELTAGLEDATPLTFGMLWDARLPVATSASAAKREEPDVNLEMIATNLTWGRPYQFPNDRAFYYDPSELRPYFPDHVMTWMADHPRAATGPAEEQHHLEHALEGKLPLPAAADLPVIVATRMSLAFPLLLSAVPLYAADFSLPLAAGRRPQLERCWFSDGGISSNFPVTLFDSPLPRWPTFAIDLGGFTASFPQSADESKNVYMVTSNQSGTLPTFTRFGALPGFLSAVLGAMQNWSDNTQSHLPGYRDRIVTVCLNDDEGGLNLDMPPDVLEKLRERGAAAGRLIASRFKEPSTLQSGNGAMNWENQRWVRLRSSLRALKTYLMAFTTALHGPQSPDVNFEGLVTATEGTPVHHYAIAADERSAVRSIMEQVAQAGDDIAKIDTLDEAFPKPPPLLSHRASLNT